MRWHFQQVRLLNASAVDLRPIGSLTPNNDKVVLGCQRGPPRDTAYRMVVSFLPVSMIPSETSDRMTSRYLC